MNNITKDIVSAMLTATKPKEQWTYCPVFRCAMNTGWAAGVDKNKCRIGNDCNNCSVLKKQE